MAISLKATGAWVENIAAGPTVTLVGTPAAGDRVYIWAAWKTYTITASMPAGWNKVTEYTEGAVAAGDGTGSMKVACWYRDWQAGDTNPVLTFSTATNLISGIVCQLWQKGAGEAWGTPTFQTVSWLSHAGPTTRGGDIPTAVPNGAVVMCLMAFADESALMTRPTTGINATGPAITWNGNNVESPATHFSTTTGNDMAADLGHRFVSVGAASTTLTANTTLSAAETGAIIWVTQNVSAAAAAPVKGKLSYVPVHRAGLY